jgi:hypothetical protein
MRLENPAAFKAATNLEEIAIMLEECVDSWVTQWRNDGIFQGRQEGLQKGRQEGRQEGEVLVLKKLLRKRFGNLPSWVDDKLGKACANELEFWVEAILDAKTLDEVFLVRADF